MPFPYRQMRRHGSFVVPALSHNSLLKFGRKLLRPWAVSMRFAVAHKNIANLCGKLLAFALIYHRHNPREGFAMLKTLIGTSLGLGVMTSFGINGFAQEAKLPPNINDLCPQMIVEKVGNVIKCKPPLADSLERIINDMQSEDLRRNPVQAGDEGNREALSHLPDASHKAALDALAAYKALYKRYEGLDAQSFKGSDRLNYQLLGYALGQKILLAEHDPGRVPFTNDSGFFNMMSYVSRQTRFTNVDDYEAYAARLSELPRYFNQNIENMRRGMRTRFTASAEI
ncbi:MAG TPA: DUF885 family protein, partial [Hellea balneolensis]|nr:DUF885 family protein [Hellea balneolensis]